MAVNYATTENVHLEVISNVCGEVYVEAQGVKPNILPLGDPVVGVIFFLADDLDFVNNLLDYYITQNDYSYTFTGLITGTRYWVPTFFIDNWLIGRTYGTDEMCYRDGRIYICILGSTGDDPKSSPTYWTELKVFVAAHSTPIETLYALCLNDTVYNTGLLTGYIDLACNLCSPNDIIAPFTEVTCHSWAFYHQEGEITVNIYNYDMTTTYVTNTVQAGDTWTWDSSSDGQGDGMYIITVDDGRTTSYYYVFDTCGLNTCYKSLVNSLLCNENDPCCDSCDPTTKKKNEDYRLELNKVNMLFFELMMSINSFRLEYIGYDAPTVSMLSKIKYINDIINKIKTIMTRCGDCGNSGTSKPCNC